MTRSNRAMMRLKRDIARNVRVGASPMVGQTKEQGGRSIVEPAKGKTSVAGKISNKNISRNGGLNETRKRSIY